MRLLVTCALATLCPFVASCSSDMPPAAELSWQMRCENQGGCITPLQRHIDHHDNQAGYRIGCSVRPIDDVRWTIGFEAQKLGEHGIIARNVVVPQTGGPVLDSSCRVTVIDDGNTYGGRDLGKCGPIAPNDVQPCQIKELVVEELEEGPTITGKMKCVLLRAEADHSIHREVGKAGIGNEGEAFAFRFERCL